jgi:hypothetical protein
VLDAEQQYRCAHCFYSFTHLLVAAGYTHGVLCSHTHLWCIKATGDPGSFAISSALKAASWRYGVKDPQARKLLSKA